MEWKVSEFDLFRIHAPSILMFCCKSDMSLPAVPTCRGLPTALCMEGPHELCGHPLTKAHSWGSSNEFLSGNTFSTFFPLYLFNTSLGLVFKKFSYSGYLKILKQDYFYFKI